MYSKNERIAFFDIETTGLEFDEDRIISMSIVITDQAGNHINTWSSRFNPEGVAIKPEAFEKHGITDAELLGCPLFRDKAEEIARFVEGCDIGGHNVTKFDIPMLITEMGRAGVYFSVEKRRIVDTLTIYRSQHASSLTTIYREYYKTDPKYAMHDSYGDTCAAIDIYKAMVRVYKLDRAEIDKICSNGKRIDMRGLFVFDDDGDIRIGKGRYKGQRVEDIDVTYLKWVFEDSDFPAETKSLAIRCYQYLLEKRIHELQNGKQ